MHLLTITIIAQILISLLSAQNSINRTVRSTDPASVTDNGTIHPSPDDNSPQIQSDRLHQLVRQNNEELAEIKAALRTFASKQAEDNEIMLERIASLADRLLYCNLPKSCSEAKTINGSVSIIPLGFSKLFELA